MEVKKICHVTSAHPPEDGRIFRRACVSSAKAGYETYLVERGNSYDKNGVHIVGIGMPARKSRIYRMTAFARKAYRQSLELNADLYHLHDPELLPYALKLKKHNKAVVFDSHENYVDQIKEKPYLPKVVARVAAKVYDTLSRRVFAEIDGLTFAGNGETLTAFDTMCQRVVPTDNLPWKYELYDKYDKGISREKNTACYIGGLDEVRGLTQCIKACYKAGCKLYLAGVFHSDAYREKVMSMAEYSCVEYLGVIDRDQVAELLQKVEIGLCTLLDIGQYYKMINFPTKVYEYMSMAMPIIVNDSLYNVRRVKELQIGLCVDPMDVDAYSDAIKKLMESQELREFYGRNGRKAIDEHYSWDSAQEKLLAMYHDILDE